MFEHVRKRDGRIEEFQEEKIVEAIFKAARACGGQDRAQAERLCNDDLVMATELHRGGTLYVEDIQDLVERSLIKGAMPGRPRPSSFTGKSAGRPARKTP